jgi:endonuclease/exonuclease/phosphatase family metal-dependent hydrolase
MAGEPEPRDNRPMGLASRCSTALALAAALGASAPAHAAPRDGATVDVATLNTWGLPFPIAWQARGRRFPAIQRWLERKQFDVVGLQEVWNGARRLLEMGGVSMPDSPGDSGLALYTPHRVTRAPELTVFDAARGVDRLKQKGVLVAAIDLPDTGEVNVLVTHMQAGGGTRNAAVRASQVEQLLGVLTELTGPALVMGDFNLYAGNPTDDASRDALVGAGLIDLAERGGALEPTHGGDRQRFDRVYLLQEPGMVARVEHAEVEVQDAAELSDHRPVLARLLLRRAR